MIIVFLFFAIVLFISIITGVVLLINNRNSSINNMDSNQIKSKVSAKDFFLNLGFFVALYTLVGNLISLLFTIINTAYPKITNGYNYSGSSSISWPVATLIILFPIFILLAWFLEKQYKAEPDKQDSIIRRAFTYITLFVSGCVIVGDLITVVYYFIDGQEITIGFILKVLVLLIIVSSIFIYFISDLRNKLTPRLRIFWRIFAGAIIAGSIIWGFAVLGTPATQRLVKYDEQKVSDLQNINNQVTNYYSIKGILPTTLAEMANGNFFIALTDSQTGKPYEYQKTGETTYDLCAEFNKASNDNRNIARPVSPFGDFSWTHPAGRYCFKETINPRDFPFLKQVPIR